MSSMTGTVRIAYLHHSTGEIVWAGGLHPRLHRLWTRYVPDFAKSWARPAWSGGVPDFIRQWNAANGTDYRVTEFTYPATTAGYPWANYPYDYWNLWIGHQGADRDRGELNLDDLVRDYDVIVFKHCFPVSGIEADEGSPSVSSDRKTIANYQLQYESLKQRLHQFPSKRFIVWTGPVLPQQSTDAGKARRARAFFDWVKNTWDEKGDNIFVWDYHALAADRDGFLDPGRARAPGDSHPGRAFARSVAPLLARRIVDVIEGRGDSASLTGAPARKSGSNRPASVETTQLTR